VARRTAHRARAPDSDHRATAALLISASQHQPRKNMSKTQDSKKQNKKTPQKTLKEKRAVKQAKKTR
jgi:hypothetical protein